ncbi:LLM class F420-dependent oxidoreductase [Mycobacteroides sp. PCS013]|uniref:LLM class F420-dependent oxidoreductase n=1 Tax=Mycobacteroides sp. PCS013 TaxID=3074106 RepID=UPI003C3048DF
MARVAETLEFGVFIPQGWRLDLVGIAPDCQWDVMRDLVRYAEDGPWDSVWVYDHFHTVPVPTDEATHEAWTLMSAFAAVTSRIKLGQMCTAMGYRNPVYLAKIAATVDIISGGRTQMGIGGGWYEHEWRAYGYGFPDAAERLGRLREGVRIMRDAWRDGRVTLDGTYYQVDDAIVAPKPLQPKGIPLWVAGGGEKVTLRIAARYAQYTNFGQTPEEFEHKSKILAAHCKDIGTDFDAIVRSANINVVIGADDAEVADRLAAIKARLVPVVGEDIADVTVGNLTATAGTPEQIAERLAQFRRLGLGYAICNFPEAAYDRSGIDLFVREIVAARV